MDGWICTPRVTNLWENLEAEAARIRPNTVKQLWGYLQGGGDQVFAVQERKMGLSRFPDAFEGGVIPVLIIRTALSIAMVRDILISLLRKMGLKVKTEPPELAKTLSSYAYAEEEAS